MCARRWEYVIQLTRSGVLSQAAFTDSFAKLIKFYKKVNKNNDCFCLGQRNLTALDALMV